jgi:hypothetical protein
MATVVVTINLSTIKFYMVMRINKKQQNKEIIESSYSQYSIIKAPNYSKM